MRMYACAQACMYDYVKYTNSKISAQCTLFLIACISLLH